MAAGLAKMEMEAWNLLRLRRGMVAHGDEA
jgi:hypothetical protein